MIDNVAAKTLKSLIVNLLTSTAKNYFGTDSEIRKTTLPTLQAAYKEARAEEARKKERARKRKKFRSNLKKYLPKTVSCLRMLDASIKEIDLDTVTGLDLAQDKLDKTKAEIRDYVLGDVPSNLSEEYQSQYDEFMHYKKATRALIDETQVKLNLRLEEVSQASPREHLEKKIRSHKAVLVHSTSSYKKRIHALQTGEFERVGELISERQALLEERATPILVQTERGALDLQEAMTRIEAVREEIEEENEALFEPYIGALESLSESIDLETLAVFGMEKVSELREEVDRLNELAQLGIAIEIIGHELQSYDDLIGSGMRELPNKIIGSDAYLSIETGYEGLTDQLRFLSPLKLSGNKVQRDVTGDEIFQYLSKFFGQSFSKNDIEFSATDAFRSFVVYDQPSRLYPVFINLVNNSRYWVANHEIDGKKILLDVVGEAVVISDNGPGVDGSDISSLFTLFFSNKRHGGRGVGLYLCRANLTAGGHKIDYEPDTSSMPLSGANFLLEFRGAHYGE